MIDSTSHVFVVGMVTATVTVLSELVGAAESPRRLRTILESVRTAMAVTVEDRESVVVVVKVPEVMIAG